MFTYKIDEDLSLRLVEMNDADRIFELTDASRDYLRQWLPWVDYTKSPADSMEFIKMAKKGYSENSSMNMVILYKNEIVGLTGYNRIDWTNKAVSIGYWLGKEYQGNGIMTRAVHALTEYAFMELKMKRIEIRAAMENNRSRSIPERLGFVYEGCLRQTEWLYDHYVDHAVYSMLSDDWNAAEMLS